MHSKHISKQLVLRWISKPNEAIFDAGSVANFGSRTTGLLTVTQQQFDSMQSLFFNIGGVSCHVPFNGARRN